MSFLRRLLGDDNDAPGEEPSNVEVDGDTHGVDDAEDLGAVYLEFIGGSSAKFYAGVLEEASDGSWSVAFNFGRIGFPREWARKVEGVDAARARTTLVDLISEKQRKGYERRPWPAYLALPNGQRPVAAEDSPAAASRGIYASAVQGKLPDDGETTVAGVTLPPGHRLSPSPEGGPRGDAAVLWVSDAPIPNVTQLWKPIAQAFEATGLWPLVVDPQHGIDRMPEVMMDVAPSLGSEPFSLLRRWWHESSGIEEDEFDDEAFAPFGRKFPGLAPRIPGPRPASVDDLVVGLEGHLGLAAVQRPCHVLEVIGWMGPANYDMNPIEQSAILDTWEDRFDAYIVGLGFDTITLVVGRPPMDRRAAEQVAAEHLAFCSDNIFQGVGSIAEYAPLLVREHRWDFWWD